MMKRHPDWSLEECQAIVNGQVRTGFSKEQTIAAWGKPDDINRTVGTWGTHEQWVYVRQGYNAQYLYFENGFLTAFQD
jgi:hypothetical protein